MKRYVLTDWIEYAPNDYRMYVFPRPPNIALAAEVYYSKPLNCFKCKVHCMEPELDFSARTAEEGKETIKTVLEEIGHKIVPNKMIVML